MINAKNILISLGLLLIQSTTLFANDIDILTISVDKLLSDVEKSCPDNWVDLGKKISDAEAEAIAVVWAGSNGDAASVNDRNAFIQYTAETPPIAHGTIKHHCTIARTALLSFYYSNLPHEVVAAMQNVDYVIGDIVDGFEVGDIRYTGRTEQADGWIALKGQTIGASNSNAMLKGEEYRALFEIAKKWFHNDREAGTKVWSEGHTATLPNLTGRVIVAGESTNIGTTFGASTIALTNNQLPTHAHATNIKGHHTPTMAYSGNHTHALKTSAHTGSSSGGSAHYMEGKMRPGAQNTITRSVVWSGEHKHNINPVGGHDHTITPAGLGQSFSLNQPSMRFLVEMKYK